MKWLREIGDFLWPTLEPESEEERLEREQQEQERLKEVRELPAQAAEKVLQDARAAYHEEEERRRGTETKAAAYFVLIAALVPLVWSLSGLSAESGLIGVAAPRWLVLILLGLGLAYLLMSARWAFRVLAVGAYHQLVPTDLVRAGEALPDVERQLAVAYLEKCLRNHQPVNEKVSGLRMAHKYLGRALLMFGGIGLVEVGAQLFPYGGGLWRIAREVLCR